MITSYRSLRVWQQGMDLAEEVYRLTRMFPAGSRLAEQMQHAAVQVPSNLARGQAPGFAGEYVGHVAAAEAALAELMTYVELALRVGYLTERKAAHLRSTGDGLGKQLWGFRTSIKESRAPAAAATATPSLPHDHAAVHVEHLPRHV